MATLADLARMATATAGTGTITLGSAASGYLTFAQAGITDGQTVSYAIADGSSREVGRGVYTSAGTTLTRNVLKSTNSNAAINLSGTAEVFITALVEDIAHVSGGYGALIYLGSNLAATTGSDAATIFDTSSYNDAVQPADAGGTQRFWLGASKTMTVASTSAGVETLTITSHGLTTGEGPILFTNSGGGLPGGISAGTKYWAIVADANTISLATSRANAIASTKVDITSNGTGTHTMASGAKLVVPSGISRVQLAGSMVDNGAAINVNITICKNGATTAYPGIGRQDNGSTGSQGSTVLTAPISVSEGDYFELWNLAGSADTLIAEKTWLSIIALR